MPRAAIKRLIEPGVAEVAASSTPEASFIRRFPDMDAARRRVVIGKQRRNEINGVQMTEADEVLSLNPRVVKENRTSPHMSG